MTGALWAALLLCAAPADAPRAPETAPNRQLDLTAEVLSPQEGQFNLFFLEYSHGILPGLQVSSHLGGLLLSLVNLNAEYQVLRRDEVTASLEVGVYWLGLAALAKSTLVQAHLLPRATIPLADDLDLTASFELRALVLNIPGFALNNRDFRGELSLIRYDPSGAWILRGRFPLVTQQTMRVAELLGKTDAGGALVLDDLSAWSVTISRDQLFGDVAHLRFGVGYRNRPGILFVDSLGNVLLELDVYWR